MKPAKGKPVKGKPSTGRGKQPAKKAVSITTTGAAARTSKPFWRQRVLLPVWLWLLIGATAAALILFLSRGGDEVAAPVATPDPALVPAPSTAIASTPPTVAPTLAPTVAPTTALPAPAPTTLAPTVPPTTPEPPTTVTTTVTTTVATTTLAPTTTAPTTTVSTTTAAPAVTTTLAPTTVAPTTTVAPAPGAPVVRAVSAEGPCRFGPDCLIAGFTIENFDVQPQRYVCEFQDGSRFEFRFDSGGVLYACATKAPDATITIEVAGVRSQTLTRA